MSRILELLDEGRLIRKSWTGTDDQGRETACLLAALSPEVARNKAAEACPASIMPQWLAHLTPWMDDIGTLEAWPGMVRRYADLADRWHVLTDADWTRLDWTARRVAVEFCIPFAKGALTAVTNVLGLLRRAESGDTPSGKEFNRALKAADAARRTTRLNMAAAAAAAADDLRAESVWSTVNCAMQSAVVWEDAVDTLTASILDAIEAAIVAREAV